MTEPLPTPEELAAKATAAQHANCQANVAGGLLSAGFEWTPNETETYAEGARAMAAAIAKALDRLQPEAHADSPETRAYNTGYWEAIDDVLRLLRPQS